MTIPAFRKRILGWYQENRREMPWRDTHNPYKILVSEIMLQQTQVSRVLPKYELFLEHFPTVEKLAKANDAKLLEVWSGLGYWRRARFLKAAAQEIIKKHNGQFPRDVPTLETLPGIGPYTAGAVACFAFGNDEPFLDTNIRRVFLHFFFPDQTAVTDSSILPIARQAVWRENPREWHYALFDYGATVLKSQAINKRSKHYHKQSTFAGSFRSFRTKVVQLLLVMPGQSLPSDKLMRFLEMELSHANSQFAPDAIIEALVSDKLLKKRGDLYKL
jgi:A/G-specific adenine glycosylase